MAEELEICVASALASRALRKVPRCSDRALSDVLRCARLAKTEPSVWEVARHESSFTEEQFNNRESILYMPLSKFTDWFRLKNGLYDYDDWAFSLGPVLREWAHPDFDGDEIAVLRRHIFPNKYIDDVADDT